MGGLIDNSEIQDAVQIHESQDGNMEPCDDTTTIDSPQEKMGGGSIDNSEIQDSKTNDAVQIHESQDGNMEPCDDTTTIDSPQEKMGGGSTDNSEIQDSKINDPAQKYESQDGYMETCDDTTMIDSPQGHGSLKQDRDTNFRKSNITLVLVGNTGNGKSATGNTILGRRRFKSMPNASSVTCTCELESKPLPDGRTINVIDTQGFGDTLIQHGMLIEEVIRCFDLAKNEIHAILLVVSVRSRFSKEEEAAIRNLQTILGTNVVNYVIVVFTGGDDLEKQEKTLNDYLGHDCPDPLNDIIGLCGKRCILFDNRTKSEQRKAEQVQQLLFQVDKMIHHNGGNPFKHSLYELQKRNEELINETKKFNSDQMYCERGTTEPAYKSHDENKMQMLNVKRNEELLDETNNDNSYQWNSKYWTAEQANKSHDENKTQMRNMKGMEVSDKSTKEVTTFSQRRNRDGSLKQDQDTNFCKSNVTIVLVGHTGNGKSATGNTILGGRRFKSMLSASSVTCTCELESKQLSNGRTINVIDTQGFGDTFIQHELILKELTKCFNLAKNEIHAILLVVSVRSRFSKEEEAAIRNLQTILGTNVINYVIVVFTGGDDLEKQEKTLKDYLGHDCPDPLKDIIRLCWERCILFDNKTESERKKNEQLQELLAQVDTMIYHNGGNPFKHNLYELEKSVMELLDETKKVNSYQGYLEFGTTEQAYKGHDENNTQMRNVGGYQSRRNDITTSQPERAEEAACNYKEKQKQRASHVHGSEGSYYALLTCGYHRTINVYCVY